MKKLIIVIVIVVFACICEAPTYKMNIGVYQGDVATESASPNYRWNIGADQNDVPSEPPEPPSGGGGSMYLNPILLGENW